MPQPTPTAVSDLLCTASELAQGRSQRPSTAHLLLALLLRGGEAADLLFERGLSAETMRSAIKVVGDEPRDALAEASESADRIARDCGDRRVGPLHMLVALARQTDSAAFRALTEGGCNVPALRNAALASISGSRWQRQSQVAPVKAEQGSASSEGSPRQGKAPPPSTPSARRSPPAPLLRSSSRIRPRQDPRPTPEEAEAPGPRVEAHSKPPAAPTPAHAPARPPADALELDPRQFPWLSSLGRNLSVAAAAGRLDPLIGRTRELEQVLDVLAKRRANNPCLVGPPGVGKTAIVEGLAQKLVSPAGGTATGRARIVIELAMGEVLAGTHLRGTLSERLAGIRKETELAAGRIVVFFDEIHSLLSPATEGEPANELKSALARGTLQCVGATTAEEYRKSFESDAALARRFSRIDVDEPSHEDATRVVEGLLGRYGEHHGVAYSPDAAQLAVRWSARYIVDRKLPDKAVGVLDLAGARAHRRNLGRVGAAEVASVVADLADVPVERLLCTDAEKLLALEKHLSLQIVGHEDAIGRISSALRRNAVGFRSRRPVGSFLFLGPTGVGKTETARALASFMYPAGAATTRLDMSEYAEPHALARLIGAPPGYVGHEDGGQLTEAVRRRPYQLLLLDEIEKAHREVLQALLQVLDEGRLTDGRGRTVDFANAIVVMTSNLGGEAAASPRSGRIGFSSAESSDGEAARALEAARRALPIELWNRIDETLYFAPLTRDEVGGVARLLLGRTAEALAAEHAVSLAFDDAAIAALIASGGWDRALGGRPMRRTIQRLVEGPLAEALLSQRLRRGGQVRVTAREGTLALDLSNGRAAGRAR
ncbi:MAG: AAA family ATPase [Deltaproteobacteria bacterium]|nr:AAA family ATPase [Deltaproteobacteria bacterium]